MSKFGRHFHLGFALLVGGAMAQAAGVPPAEPIEFFERHVRPVLANECYECHGAKKQEAGLRLDSRDGVRKGGESGPALIAGDAEKSLLIQAIRHTRKEPQMPKDRPKLADFVIADLVTWVNMNAPDPRDEPAAVILSDSAAKVAAGKDWWSFQPLRNPMVPKAANAAGSEQPVDLFILARLEATGVRPAARADNLTLIRRATFDLTGLPPTPEEIAAFTADHSTNAFATVVERLLNSPHYGERWGRHWLDVVRYADTAGDTADYPVGLAWRYRNYVINAFNTDKPYDEFIREQIAGDLLAEQGTREQYAERVTATGFLAISRRFGFDSENYHHLTIQDTLDTMGQTVLGLSLGCARCHDHKFDPVSMSDYYALYGIFASSRYAFPGSEQKGKLRAMVPLVPPAESQPAWRAYDQRVAQLSEQIARQKQPVPAAVFRSLHDPDGDFEIQKDAAGGSYGVIVPPWLAEGKVSVTTTAQSSYKNLYPMGKFGASIAGGKHEYRLEQSLHPRRTRDATRWLHVNLDFRATVPETGAPGSHRFWLGAGTDSPALELLISGDAIRVPSGGRTEILAPLKQRRWYNLQLTLDLESRTFAGSVGEAESSVTFSNQSLAAGWSGAIDHMMVDSRARAEGELPGLEIDNFGVQPEPIPPVTTTLPAFTVEPGAPDPAALDAELQNLVGLDGDFEWQTAEAPPAKPWNPGPNSQVKVTAAAQSPYHNIFPAGQLGVALPNRGEYDGFGLTLATKYSAASNDVLHVAFDFQCGNQDAGGAGSWRYYLGHGSGSSAAVELFFNSREFFARSGASSALIAPLRSDEWQQVQLRLDLKARSYTGILATPDGSTRFSGTFAAGWDGTIDYTFIDSYGQQPGVRPALAADNFAFREAPFPALDAPPQLGVVAEREAQRARVGELHRQLAVLRQTVTADTRELTDLLTAGPCATTYGVVEGTPQNARQQLRGEPDRLGAEIPRGFIKVLGGGALPAGTAGSGRLELAQWLTQTNRPLTARVMVNRIWQHHFGHGLVATPNDFGARGQHPTHPELLDYLASAFVASGWSIKAVHRLIMHSATYQQAGEEAALSRRAAGGDGDIATARSTTDYAVFARRRFSAEELRDAMLAISGELDPNPGQGHPFPSPVTTAYSQHGPFSAVYDHNQRSVYLMTQRLKRHPFLALFDGPDPNAPTADRRTTTVPTQALYFLNSAFVHEQAAKCAQRLRALCPDNPRQIDYAWRLTTGRAPTELERNEAVEFLAAYRAGLLAAGQSEAEPAALAAYVRSLFASNEFLHVD